MTLTAKYYEKGFCPTTNYDVPNDPPLTEAFKIGINMRKSICSTDATHGNYIQK